MTKAPKIFGAFGRFRGEDRQGDWSLGSRLTCQIAARDGEEGFDVALLHDAVAPLLCVTLM